MSKPASTPTTEPATPPAQPATPRRRAYSPRISKKGANNKDPLVLQKGRELRDARMLTRLIAEVKDLTPWGLGQLNDAIKKLPVQPELPAAAPAAPASPA